MAYLAAKTVAVILGTIAAMIGTTWLLLLSKGSAEEDDQNDKG